VSPVETTPEDPVAIGSGPAVPIQVRPGEPAEDGRRDAFVRAHPRGSFFHLAGWRRVVEEVHGHAPRDLYAWRGERLVGVLPQMLCRGLFGGLKLISMPYGVYGGPLGDDAEVEAELRETAVRMAESLRVDFLEFRCEEEPGDGWPESNLYWTFKRDLPEDPDEVLPSIPKKARAEVRKARKRHGLELTPGPWYVDDLVRLFLENKHSLGSPALPAEHFRALLSEFPDDTHVHLVTREREPIAAVMSFAFEKTLVAYYAGTKVGQDRAVSASNFMYAALQEWAVRKGFRVFDFCRSRADSGAFSFKRHQGFEPRQLHYRFHLVRKRELPDFNPSNPRTQALQRVWSRLPLWAARKVSDRLSRYLP